MDRAKVQATMPADLESLLRYTSEKDLQVIRGSLGLDPEAALREEIYSGRKTFTGFINSQPVCMFGAYQKTLLDGDIFVWMLGTMKLREYPVFFMKHCVPVFQQLVGDHESVFAVVDFENKQAYRWMKKLGFTQVDTMRLNNDLEFPLMKLTERKWLS